MKTLNVFVYIDIVYIGLIRWFSELLPESIARVVEQTDEKENFELQIV